eukprot:XP_011522454.1 uncharacterized protein C17orf99 isoform X3 [Homo sapiens]
MDTFCPPREPGILRLRAASSFSKAREEEITPVVSIAYKVLEVFPKGRWVLITCCAPQPPPPITYSLCGTKNIKVAKKVVKTHEPASFNLNVTLKSSPDLLTYFCWASSTSGAHVDSARLQMHWELWSKPVSELRANFTLQDRGAGPRVEMICQASSGSPPITNSLIGKDGQVHLQQRPCHRQPANFSFLPSQTSDWFWCQAANNANVQHSALTVVPPGGDQKMEDWQGPLESPILALPLYRSTRRLSEEEFGGFRIGNGEVRGRKAAAM